MNMHYVSIVVVKLFLFVTLVGLQGASLDGTATVQHQSGSYAFSSGDFARGFVRLDGGFSVPAGGVVTLNMVVPAAGNINLNSTGAIKLEGDLLLAANVGLSAGGVIDGQGHAVVMQGNVSIQANESLEFASDTIIDGMGHHLKLVGDATTNGRLYINGPSGTRVTLRNLHLHGVRDINGNPAVYFGANAGQILVLENVTIHLRDDFTFAGGGLIIRGDVYLKGRYQEASRPALVQTEFNYIAAQSLVLSNDATLHLDTTVKFSYAPIDMHEGYLKFRTASSCLSLEGATMFVPGDTGLELVRGHLRIDHQSLLQGDGILTTQKGIHIGGSSDLAIDVYPGAQLAIDDAVVEYANHS